MTHKRRKPQRESEALFCSRCQQPHIAWMADSGQGSSCASSFGPSGWGRAHYGSIHDDDLFLSSPGSRQDYATPQNRDSICDACLMEGVLKGQLFHFNDNWRRGEPVDHELYARLAQDPAAALAASREAASRDLKRRKPSG